MSDFDQLVKEWASTPGYNPQLTHPDDAVLEVELDRLRAAFDTARLLEAEMIISGCGSRHATAFYGPHPENHLPATRERLIASLRRVAPWARDAGIVLALECHVTTALDTPGAHPRSHTGSGFTVGARQLRPGQPARRLRQRVGQCTRDAPHVGYARRLLRTVGTYQGRSR